MAQSDSSRFDVKIYQLLINDSAIKRFLAPLNSIIHFLSDSLFVIEEASSHQLRGSMDGKVKVNNRPTALVSNIISQQLMDC